MNTRLLIIFLFFPITCFSQISEDQALTDEEEFELFDEFLKTYDIIKFGIFQECNNPGRDIEFEYADRNYNLLEEYFTLDNRNYCYLQPTDESLYIQVYKAFYAGDHDIESIISSLKFKKIELEVNSCLGLIDKYLQFFNLAADELSIVSMENIAAAFESENLREIYMNSSTFIFNIGQSASLQTFFTIQVPNIDIPLARWSKDVIALGNECNNPPP